MDSAHPASGRCLLARDESWPGARVTTPHPLRGLPVSRSWPGTTAAAGPRSAQELVPTPRRRRKRRGRPEPVEFCSTCHTRQAGPATLPRRGRLCEKSGLGRGCPAYSPALLVTKLPPAFSAALYVSPDRGVACNVGRDDVEEFGPVRGYGTGIIGWHDSAPQPQYTLLLTRPLPTVHRGRDAATGNSRSPIVCRSCAWMGFVLTS